jgi:hypothetical protein
VPREARAFSGEVGHTDRELSLAGELRLHGDAKRHLGRPMQPPFALVVLRSQVCGSTEEHRINVSARSSSVTATSSTAPAKASSIRPSSQERQHVCGFSRWNMLRCGRLQSTLFLHCLAANALSIAVTTSGLVAVMTFHATSGTWLADPGMTRATTIISVTHVILAAVNATFISWTTALDARHAALARALGATPNQIVFGLMTAHLIPVLIGAMLGIPGGIALYQIPKDGARQGFHPRYGCWLWYWRSLPSSLCSACCQLASASVGPSPRHSRQRRRETFPVPFRSS